jgi:hypothetical protein
MKPGTVAHACNLSFLGDGDQEDGGLRPAQTKRLCEPSHPLKNSAQWPAPVIPAMQEA